MNREKIIDVMAREIYSYDQDDHGWPVAWEDLDSMDEPHIKQALYLRYGLAALTALEAAGYATELTRLRADLEKAKEALRKADAMQQLAYANGMKEGWNLGDAGDSETHAKRVAALVQEAMKELKDIRLLSQLENSK